MKFFIILTILVFSNSSYSYQCPKYLGDHPRAQKIYDWLNKFKEQKQLHNCTIEITTCTPEEGTQSMNSPIGEIFLIDRFEREVYMQFHWNATKDKKISTKIKYGDSALYYRRKDRYHEEVHGRTEVWQFEMRTLWEDHNTLDVIEIGTYETNNQLNQPNNDSRWYNCTPNH